MPFWGCFQLKARVERAIVKSTSHRTVLGHCVELSPVCGDSLQSDAASPTPDTTPCQEPSWNHLHTTFQRTARSASATHRTTSWNLHNFGKFHSCYLSTTNSRTKMMSALAFQHLQFPSPTLSLTPTPSQLLSLSLAPTPSPSPSPSLTQLPSPSLAPTPSQPLALAPLLELAREWVELADLHRTSLLHTRRTSTLTLRTTRCCLSNSCTIHRHPQSSATNSRNLRPKQSAPALELAWAAWVEELEWVVLEWAVAWGHRAKPRCPHSSKTLLRKRNSCKSCQGWSARSLTKQRCSTPWSRSS